MKKVQHYSQYLRMQFAQGHLHRNLTNIENETNRKRLSMKENERKEQIFTNEIALLQYSLSTLVCIVVVNYLDIRSCDMYPAIHTSFPVALKEAPNREIIFYRGYIIYLNIYLDLK